MVCLTNTFRKAGFADYDAPRTVCRSVFGKPKMSGGMNKQDTDVTDKAQSKRDEPGAIGWQMVWRIVRKFGFALDSSVKIASDGMHNAQAKLGRCDANEVDGSRLKVCNSSWLSSREWTKRRKELAEPSEDRLQDVDKETGEQSTRMKLSYEVSMVAGLHVCAVEAPIRDGLEGNDKFEPTPAYLQTWKFNLLPDGWQIHRTSPESCSL